MKKKFSILLTIVFVILASFSSFAAGWFEIDGFWFYQLPDGTLKTDTIMSQGEDKFYLNEDGIMVRDTLLEDYEGNTYYFGSNGAMVRNTWVTVDPTVISDPGNVIPSAYYFYFGQNGKAYKAKSGDIVKKTIDGQKYIFDSNGHRLYGWIDETGEILNEEEDPFMNAIYYCGDEYDGVMRTGWMQYDGGTTEDKYYDYSSLWFYFSETTGKKEQSTSNEGKSKKIDGANYIFDTNGVMGSGWQEVVRDSNKSQAKFYSEDYEGFLKKKTWVYTIPPEEFDSDELDEDDYATDTKRWFYTDSLGNITTNAIKKVDTKYYAFDAKGIMKTGLVVWDMSENKYKFTVDTERMDAEDYIEKRKGAEDGTAYVIDTNGNYQTIEVVSDSSTNTKADAIYYFYKDTDEGKKEGSRADNEKVEISFADGEYIFKANNQGALNGYKSSEKTYYDAGILLKAEKDEGLGLVSIADANIKNGDVYRQIVYRDNDDIKLAIVDTNGKRFNKKNALKKDKNDNYWVTDSEGYFTKIFNIQVRYGKFDSTFGVSDNGESYGWQFKSDFMVKNKPKTMYIPFMEYTFNGEVQHDIYNKTCSIKRNTGDYEKILKDRNFTLNFTWLNDDGSNSDSVYAKKD